MHRPLAMRLGAGAMHAALLLANGVAEADQQVRMQLWDLLEPLSNTTDWNLLEPLSGLGGSQTRAWLWSWAREQIRKKSSTEVAGAVHVVADLCRIGALVEADLLALVSGMSTATLAILVEDLTFRNRQQEKLQREKVVVIEALVNREDLVRNAPRFVSSVIHASYGGIGSNPLMSIIPQIGSGLITRELFGKSRIDEYGPFVMVTPRAPIKLICE